MSDWDTLYKGRKWDRFVQQWEQIGLLCNGNRPMNIVCLAKPKRLTGVNLEAWCWWDLDGPWMQLAPTEGQALIDQREYWMEMLA